MTDRDRQRDVDRLTARFIAALDAGDFAAVERLWEAASAEPEALAAFAEAAAELAGDADASALSHADGIVEAVLRRAMPAVAVIRRPSGPLTVAEVAEHLRRAGVPGLTAKELAVNDVLARCGELLPDSPGLSAVVAWGAQFGPAPRLFWKAFREAALVLRLRRESASDYQLAARPKRPKRPGGEP